MPASVREVTYCEVCGSAHLHSVLDLGSHPMCDDLVPIGDPRRCSEYPIEILFCDTCLTAHQRYQIPKRELFPPDYHYRSRHTADVLDGMRQLVSACDAQSQGLTGKMVLDVGCNDGSLLAMFREKGASTFGIEPTEAAREAAQGGHRIVEDFFTETVAAAFAKQYGRPDIVTFTNVFAHIEALDDVLRALKALASPKTMIVIENHYLGSILSGHQFDTFYHEHPRTYSCTSFAHVASALDMAIVKVEFPQRYGGNIRVFLAAAAKSSADGGHLEAVYAKERSFRETIAQLQGQIERWRRNKRAEIAGEVERHGKLRAKAFPGRAAIPIKLLGLDDELVSAAYEKPGSQKVGHYVPGTRIPILSDDDFAGNGSADAPLLNLAWHIRGEIEPYMRRRGYRGRIIDIISEDDFRERR